MGYRIETDTTAMPDIQNHMDKEPMCSPFKTLCVTTQYSTMAQVRHKDTDPKGGGGGGGSSSCLLPTNGLDQGYGFVALFVDIIIYTGLGGAHG